MDNLEQLNPTTNSKSPPTAKQKRKSKNQRQTLASPDRQATALNPRNERDNIDMGDSLHEIITHQPHHPTNTATNTEHEWKSKTIRIYFQNVNGLRLQDNGTDILETFLQLQDIEADIFGLAETQLNCRSQDVQSLIQHNKQKVWSHSKIFTCSSEEDWPRQRKPGGTMLGITGQLVGRIKCHINDKYGRWTRVDLLGRDGRTITIICAYQVVQEKGQHGDWTAYSQQIRMMRLEGNNKPEPRKQFISDLKELVKQLHSDKHDIVLMGDFNESIGVRSAGMASVMAAGQLADAYTYRHGLEQEKATYARGKKRVDYILISRRLLPHLRHTGAEPFNFRIFSDHRGLFVDFSTPGFFDRAPNALAKLHTRDLIYDCPRHVRKYLKKTAEYFRDHDIKFRLIELSQSQRDDENAESIDRDITRGMLSAEATCKSQNRSPWSKELHEAMNHLYILKRALSQRLTGLNMNSAIENMQAKLTVPIEVPTSKEAINSALKEAQKARCAVIIKGRELRQTFAQERIKALQLAWPKKAPEAVEKAYYSNKATKELFRKVPSARPKNTSGISMIKVPIDPQADPKDKATAFKAIVDPIEVEHHILNRNKKHFSQASETPLATHLISDMLGFSGTKSIADQLLEGTANINSLTTDTFGRSILHQCRRTNPEQPAEITIEEFKASYKKWRVGTSTSPSGRHLSHQHALFQPHGIDKKTEPEAHREAEDSIKDNWFAQHAIVAYGIKHGYTFERWKHIVNAMIEKEPGNPQLHRLRVIHLYESDYNLLLGIKMRQVIHKAEDLQSIHTGTYGSRATRQAMDPTLIEVLQYDYASLTRWPEITFSNDATSCYDRIIPSVSNVIARSMGLHRNIAQIHGDMLEHAIYRIKTQLGISTGFYQHSAESPVFGTGQGSCASPPFWLLNCSVYFKIYESKCHGATYRNMQGDVTLSLGMTGFVDDNKCNVNSSPEDESALNSKATHDAQLWSDILWSSGGALEHAKCSYKYLKTDFTASGAPVFRGGTFGDPIVIKDSKGKATSLTHSSAYTAYKTLGTYQAATRSQKTQFETLQTKAVRLLRILALSTCSYNAAWLYYSSVFIKGVGYPLPMSRLSKPQLHAIQAPMTSLTLNRMGYAKDTSRTVVYGPRQYGGLEFPTLSTAQGAGKLTTLIRHLRTPGQPQQLSRIVLDRLQYHAGVGYPIMEFPQRALPYLEGVWMHTVRDYMAEISGSLQISDLTIQPLQRSGDKYIMELVLSSNLFLPREIKYVNYCRLYLQVLTLADITNAQGNCFVAGIKDGYRSITQSSSLLLEPLQERPNESTWSLWRRFLRTLSPDKCWLYEPLGPWYPKLSTRRRWPNYYAHSTDTLYRYSCLKYRSHIRISPTQFAWDSTIMLVGATLPDDAIPVDVSDIDEGWYMFDSTPTETTEVIPPTPITFQEHVDSLPDHEKLLLQHHEILCDGSTELGHQLSSIKDIILVSDGGALAEYGAYGWVISHKNGTRLARGSGSVYGFNPRSYRAEGYGAKAGTLFLVQYMIFLEIQIPRGRFKFYCDNQGLLKKLHYLRSYNLALHATCMHSEWDIVSAVHQLQGLFQPMPELIHVKGHQDAHTNKDSLDLPSQLNVEADELATEALHTYGSIKDEVPFDPACGAMLKIAGRTVTRNLANAIRTQQYIAPIRQYYRIRFTWTIEDFDAIDWSVYAAVYRKFPRHRTFFTKFGWKKLPTAHRLHKRADSYDHRCPSCNQDHESDDHVFQCDTPPREQWRIRLKENIRETFTSILDPDLLTIIQVGLESFFTNCSPDFTDRFPEGYSSTPYAEIIDQQNEIGWDQFLRGKVSKEWEVRQYYYALKYGLLKESEGWMISLIRIMANKSFQLWEIRNGFRHGSDAASKSEILKIQTHREIRCIYRLQDSVLEPDKALFRDNVERHLQETTAQLRSWLMHNKKLILHSVRIQHAQNSLQTHRIQTFFTQKKSTSSKKKTPGNNNSIPQRHRTTRISTHFTARGCTSTSVIRPSKQRMPQKLRSSSMTQYFLCTGTNKSILPLLDEDNELTDTALLRRRLRRRTLNIPGLYPDHPG